MSNINSFISTFQNDFSNPSKFDVSIFPNNKLLTLLPAADRRRLTFACEKAELPGKMFQTVHQKTYGPIQKFPSFMNFNDIVMLFKCSSDLFEKRFFEKWIDYISGDQNKYNVKYKDDIQAEILITKYNNMNQIVYTARLEEAFPYAINQLDVDWNMINSTNKLAISFAYTRYKEELSFEVNMQPIS